MIQKIKSIVYRFFYIIKFIFCNKKKCTMPWCFNSMIAPFADFEIEKKGTFKCGMRFALLKNAVIKVRAKGKMIVGDNVTIGIRNFINIHESLTIGNNVLFAQDVKIYDHDHDVKNFPIEGMLWRNHFVTSPIVIGNNVWIGCNVVILRGAKIGNNCVVGAGCVLKGVYPDNSIIVQKRSDSVITLS